MPSHHTALTLEQPEKLGVLQEALVSDGGWALNEVEYGDIPPGSLGGIETGLRKLIRIRPLWHEQAAATPPVPTRDETLRIKACLMVRRNQAADYLDLAVLAGSWVPPGPLPS